VAPYFWAAGIDGTVTTKNTDVEFDIDFDDIWDNLESAGLILIEVGKGQFSALGDVVSLGLDLDGEAPGGVGADADVTMTILQLAGLYRVTPTSPFEVGGGMRYSTVDTDLDVGAVSVDGDRDVFDGFVAGRARWPFARRWDVTFYGDVGGGDSGRLRPCSATSSRAGVWESGIGRSTTTSRRAPTD